MKITLVIIALFSIGFLIGGCILFYETYALKKLKPTYAVILSCKEKSTRYGLNYKIRAEVKNSKKEVVLSYSSKSKQYFEIGNDIPVILVKNWKHAIYAKANGKALLAASVICMLLAFCMLIPLILCLSMIAR